MHSGVAQYRNVQAKTTDPRSLLVLLYDKILQQIVYAGAALTASASTSDHQQPLMKAQLGVLELDKTLNWHVLPELAESLHNLYMHILLKLGDAFSKGDLEALRRAEALLGELRATWKEAILIEQRTEQPRAKAV